MTRPLGLILTLGFAVLVRLSPEFQGSQGGAAALALGVTLLISYYTGRMFASWGLPSLTGYLAVGMLFGPHLLGAWYAPLGILDQKATDTLGLLDAVALGLIALTAGGELKMLALRKMAGKILGVITGQILVVTSGVVLAIFLTKSWFPLLADMGNGEVLAAALLFGVVALANSPATTLAIIQEFRTSGPVTDLALGVTVTKDIVVITLFTGVLSLAISLMGAEAGEFFLPRLAWEMFGSMAVGLGVGWLISRYLALVGYEAPVLMLGVAFLAVTLLPTWHLSGLLALMVAGFTIENFSVHGDTLIKAIERHSLPVYVVFFTIAGARLDLTSLVEMWPLALFLGAIRLVLTMAGTISGVWLAGGRGPLVAYGWSGFLAQAGVTMGFALLVEERVPGIGHGISTVILSVVALNQLIGPLLFRLGLGWAGEIPEKEAPGPSKEVAGGLTSERP